MAGPKFTKQMTVAQFDRLFPTDDACKAYLVAQRWPNGVRCPHCGSDRVYALKTMPFKWECPACSPKGYRFSVLVGTIFENTNVSLRTWFKVIYLMLISKKGIAALQVQRMFGFGSYSTAHYMCHRVRAGLADPDFRKLVGIVEVDETYIGGKNRNRHWDKRTPGTGCEGKDTVVGAVERKGNVVARVIEHADTETLNSFIREAISEKVNLIATDECPGYWNTQDIAS
jgi:transposase-like protein